MHGVRGSVADPRAFLRPDLRGERATYTRPHEPPGLARLHMNEAARDFPPAARAAFLERLAHAPLSTYPETEGEVTRRLEERMGAPEGAVLLGPSSGALLDLVALAGLSVGDRVAIPDPGFSLYPALVRRHGGVCEKVDVGFGLPLEGFARAAAAGVRQVWLTLPNNPTGASCELSRVVSLLDEIARLPEPPLVVLDEAYAEFSPRTARLLPERYENVLLLRTFSKALASAGLRLGALVGPKDLVAELARLKLPYSLSTPQLIALDVALDHAAAFDVAVRETVERRTRFVDALERAGVPVSPTTANFVHTARDVADTLAAHGLLARRLGGALGTRISIGTEEECEAAVRALGGRLAAPTPVAAAPLLVLDIDGVMIDAEASFREAVRLALSEMRPGLVWDDRYFRAMKRLGGMNNDFRLCAGVAVLGDRGRLGELLEGRVTWDEGLEAALSELFAEAAARVARHYEHTRACEVPLVTHAELEALGVPFAILTGRDPRELRDAMGTLGFTCEAVCAHAPHVEKPRPGGLLQLADAFRATHVVFVGDTRDDRAALVAAAKLRPETHFRFAAVGPDRDSFARATEGDRAAATLRDLLAEGPLFPDAPRSPV